MDFEHNVARMVPLRRLGGEYMAGVLSGLQSDLRALALESGKRHKDVKEVAKILTGKAALLPAST